ncbi:hypothetical protein BC826DRAFT_1025761 [Russula brevipes]|nr:hypothetical protein BC826DRAFT_1025761 [Russula brevipes]
MRKSIAAKQAKQGLIRRTVMDSPPCFSSSPAALHHVFRSAEQVGLTKWQPHASGSGITNNRPGVNELFYQHISRLGFCMADGTPHAASPVPPVQPGHLRSDFSFRYSISQPSALLGFLSPSPLPFPPSRKDRFSGAGGHVHCARRTLSGRRAPGHRSAINQRV